ncbi:hypothetical protein Hdeb2414_s0010g00343171 [Helianthus debilis subsp. tardiflorus]
MCLAIIILTKCMLAIIDKRIVSLQEIRQTWEYIYIYIADLKLHPEVNAQVRLNAFAN